MWLTFAGLVLAAAGADDRSANERALAAAEAALDRADPGWRLDAVLGELAAACPPDDQNLARLCRAIQEAVPRRFDRWRGERDEGLRPKARNRLPAAAVLAEARAELAAADAAVRLARTVRQRPTGGWRATRPADTGRTVGEMIRQAEPARAVAALLDVDGAVAAADGDGPRAVAAAADTLHLCRAVGDDPFLVPHLVRMALGANAAAAAERAVGWGEPPAALLAPLQAGLLAEADVPRLVLAFRGERALTHREYADLDAGRLKLTDFDRQTTDDFPSYRPRLPRDQARALELQTEQLAVVRRPSHEWADRLAALKPPPDKPGTAIGDGLVPTTGPGVAGELRTRARLRSAAAGLACERFRQHHNRWPNDLAELKELLPTIPIDPYDGQPLRFGKLPDGVVVYSVGPDRADDGGTLSYGQPRPGEDIGFRLWDVAARRAEP